MLNRIFDLGPKMIGRAMRLKCPACGRGSMMANWLSMVPKCSDCGLDTLRGEHDHYLGGMMFNIILAEGVFVAAIILAAILTWPEPPWNLLMYGGAAGMLAAPFILYPWSRVLWLAIDILLRPEVDHDDQYFT